MDRNRTAGRAPEVQMAETPRSILPPQAAPCIRIAPAFPTLPSSNVPSCSLGRPKLGVGSHNVCLHLSHPVSSTTSHNVASSFRVSHPPPLAPLPLVASPRDPRPAVSPPCPIHPFSSPRPRLCACSITGTTNTTHGRFITVRLSVSHFIYTFFYPRVYLTGDRASSHSSPPRRPFVTPLFASHLVVKGTSVVSQAPPATAGHPGLLH